jgi:hypothetical protein
MEAKRVMRDQVKKIVSLVNQSEKDTQSKKIVQKV